MAVTLDEQKLYPDIGPALRKLDEEALRERVLPVLLRRLEFIDVRSRHGPMERGKDLLAWRRGPLGTADWYAFVVKSGNLNAQVAHVAGIRTVLHQVEQALDHEVVDPLTSASSIVREAWVVTNGAIPGHAVDEIGATLRRHHLDRVLRWVDIEVLTRLLSALPRDELEVMLELKPSSEGKE